MIIIFFEYLFRSQQDWFAHIKGWRESLAKYEPDWNEIMSTVKPVEPTPKPDNPVRKTREEKPTTVKKAAAARKPVEFSKPEPATPETGNPVKGVSGNEEKAPKRKPIVFDLKEDAGNPASDDIEVKPVTITPTQAQHRQNKFKTVDKIVDKVMEEEEDVPGQHQNYDDLIILDQTEEDSDAVVEVTQNVKVKPSSIFNRLGGKVVSAAQLPKAQPEPDLRESLKNKLKPATSTGTCTSLYSKCLKSGRMVLRILALS